MASIYTRKDSKEFWLSCYPVLGGPLVRVSLGTTDRSLAEKIKAKAELLVTLERQPEIPPAERLTVPL